MAVIINLGGKIIAMNDIDNAKLTCWVLNRDVNKQIKITMSAMDNKHCAGFENLKPITIDNSLRAVKYIYAYKEIYYQYIGTAEV